MVEKKNQEGRKVKGKHRVVDDDDDDDDDDDSSLSGNINTNK